MTYNYVIVYDAPVANFNVMLDQLYNQGFDVVESESSWANDEGYIALLEDRQSTNDAKRWLEDEYRNTFFDFGVDAN